MKMEGRPHIDEAIRRFNTELRTASARLADKLQQRAAMNLQN